MHWLAFMFVLVLLIPQPAALQTGGCSSPPGRHSVASGRSARPGYWPGSCRARGEKKSQIRSLIDHPSVLLRVSKILPPWGPMFTCRAFYFILSLGLSEETIPFIIRAEQNGLLLWPIIYNNPNVFSHCIRVLLLKVSSLKLILGNKIKDHSICEHVMLM